MYTLHLQIPWVPTSLNKGLRSHWGKRHKENIAWANYISAESVRKKPAAPLQKAKLTIVRHSHRSLDFDGLVGSLKPVVDALIFSGIIADDSWSVVGAWTVEQYFRKKVDGPLLDIIVEEI